jgi:hypothetical protein
MSQRSTRARTTFIETVTVSFDNFRLPHKPSKGLRTELDGCDEPKVDESTDNFHREGGRQLRQLHPSRKPSKGLRGCNDPVCFDPHLQTIDGFVDCAINESTDNFIPKGQPTSTVSGFASHTE